MVDSNLSSKLEEAKTAVNAQSCILFLRTARRKGSESLLIIRKAKNIRKHKIVEREYIIIIIKRKSVVEIGRGRFQLW